MVTSGIWSEKLTIHHVRNTCQRVPVIGVTVGKGQNYPMDSASNLV
jgi:hypothetical protein